MNRRTKVALLLLGVVHGTSPRPAQAQPRDTVRVGDRVRVEIAGDMRPITATLEARTGDTLVLRGGAFTQRALGRSVQQLERSLGRSRTRGARHDALWGAAIGGGVMALGGAYGMKGAEVVGAIGTWAALGGVIGALRRPERWRLAVLAMPASGTTVARRTVDTSGLAPATPDRVTPRPSEPPPLRHTLLALTPRDVIRFRANGATERVAGTVIAATDDSLLLDRGGLALRYPLREVVGLQRYYGKTSRAGAVHGSIVGGTIGVALGGLVGLALSNICFDVCNPNSSKATGVLAGAALFGGIGAGLGSLIGQTMPRDDWRTIHLESSRR
ncbi:MAG: hypothetical protein K2R93_02100 [Gemmatimonadaceae bacterium]|nr:hypothetical protein [Gemmatimonadaceae bacterium]